MRKWLGKKCVVYSVKCCGFKLCQTTRLALRKIYGNSLDPSSPPPFDNNMCISSFRPMVGSRRDDEIAIYCVQFVEKLRSKRFAWKRPARTSTTRQITSTLRFRVFGAIARPFTYYCCDYFIIIFFLQVCSVGGINNARTR